MKNGKYSRFSGKKEDLVKILIGQDSRNYLLI